MSNESVHDCEPSAFFAMRMVASRTSGSLPSAMPRQMRVMDSSVSVRSKEVASLAATVTISGAGLRFAEL